MRAFVIITVVAACGSRTPEPAPQRATLGSGTVVPGDALPATPIAIPEPEPSPPPQPCADHGCYDEARSLWRSGEYIAAIDRANLGCSVDAETCLLAADYVDDLRRANPLKLDSKVLRERGIGGLEKLCATEDAAACFALGRALVRGRHGLANPAKGKPIVLHACELGSGDACALLAAVEPNAKKALALLEKACAGKNQFACVALGEKTLGKDRKRALQLFVAACSEQVAPGCLANGHEVLRERHPDAAILMFEEACRLDRGAGCAEAAKLLEANDAPRARSDYKAACDDQYGPACLGLARMINTGKGGDRDWGASLELFARACDLEAPSACADSKRAKAHPPDWHCATEAACQHQCDEKIARSCTRLGELTAASDCSRSVDGLRMACELGDARACRLFANHAGNSLEAREKYERACDGGDAKACILKLAIVVRTETDHAVANELRAACKSHRGDACTWVNENAHEADGERALQLECDRKDARACRFLANLLGARTFFPTHGGTSSDEPPAVPTAEEAARVKRGEALLHRACTLGEALSCAVERDDPTLVPKCDPEQPDWDQ